jgi:hypothetical protein
MGNAQKAVKASGDLETSEKMLRGAKIRNAMKGAPPYTPKPPISEPNYKLRKAVAGTLGVGCSRRWRVCSFK